MSARRPSLEELVRFTDVDHERELALIATTPVQGRERQIGVARYVKESSPRPISPGRSPLPMPG
jgi:acetyltransferase